MQMSNNDEKQLKLEYKKIIEKIIIIVMIKLKILNTICKWHNLIAIIFFFM